MTYFPAEGDVIRFFNSSWNDETDYTVTHVAADAITVSTTFAGRVYSYDVPRNVFFDLSPYTAKPTVEELNALSLVYKQSLLDMLEATEAVGILTDFFGVARAMEVMPASTLEAWNDMIDEFKEAVAWVVSL